MFESIWQRKLKYEKGLCYPPSVPINIEDFTKWLIKKGIITESQLIGMPYEQLYELYNEYASEYWSEVSPEYQGVFLFLPQWENLIDIVNFRIGYNTAYNFLIDFFLAINVHIEIPELKDIIDISFPELFPSYTKIEKGVYGKTYYDLSYYDPPSVSCEDIRHFSWDIRYKYTKKIVPNFDEGKQSLYKIVQYFVEFWNRKNIANYIVPMILEHIPIFEGKIMNCMYVGLWVVGVSPIPKRNDFIAEIDVRNPFDLFNTLKIETATILENHVGFMRVGFFRVAPKKSYVKDKSKPLLPKPVVEYLASKLRYLFEANGYKDGIFIPTVRYLSSGEKKKWEGGKHQVRMQSLLNRIRKVLDRYGVCKWYRMAYLNFALELEYVKHESNRKRKNWKHVQTVDDVIAKYLSRGCNKTVLEEIVKVMGV